MELLTDLAAWFADTANWSGRDAIPVRLGEHLLISGLAMAAALALALPIGLYIGHSGRFGFVAINLANIGRAVPSYAVLVVFFGIFVMETRNAALFTNGPTVLAMIALAVPPIVTNAWVGLRAVDTDLVEAARGMGMRESQVLRRVELPLALPVILAGIRTATVQVIATAALGAVIGGGGLGRYIVQGLARFDDARLLAGAVMVAALAIGAEVGLGWLERRAAARTSSAADAGATSGGRPAGAARPAAV